MYHSVTVWDSISGEMTSSGKRASQMLGWYESNLIALRVGKCDVHWGHHSCNMERGHSQSFDGHHICICKAFPYHYSVFRGSDQSEEEKSQRESRLDEMYFEELRSNLDDRHFTKSGRPRKKAARRKKKANDETSSEALPILSDTTSLEG
jgi:hypothetical protein